MHRPGKGRGGSRREDAISVAALLLLWMLCFCLLELLNIAFANPRGAPAFVFRPVWVVWVADSLLLADLILLARYEWLIDAFARLLHQPFPEPAPKMSAVVRIVARTALVLMLAGSVMLMRAGCTFSPQGVTVQPLTSWPSRHWSWRDVTGVRMAFYEDHGRRRSAERALYISFRDGSEWSTQSGLTDAPAPVRWKAARYAAERSGTALELP